MYTVIRVGIGLYVLRMLRTFPGGRGVVEADGSRVIVKKTMYVAGVSVVTS